MSGKNSHFSVGECRALILQTDVRGRSSTSSLRGRPPNFFTRVAELNHSNSSPLEGWCHTTFPTPFHGPLSSVEQLLRFLRTGSLWPRAGSSGWTPFGNGKNGTVNKWVFSSRFGPIFLNHIPPQPSTTYTPCAMPAVSPFPRAVRAVLWTERRICAVEGGCSGW